MNLVIGYFILIGFPLVGLFWILRQYGKQLDAERDDALIRAVNGYQSDTPTARQHASDDDGMLAAAAVVVALETSGDFLRAPMPEVFRSRRRPWSWGGNAHQRRVLRRYFERAAA